MAGGIYSLAAVLIGAFGAHALKPLLEAKAMGWIDTGVFYQAIHALALIACGLLPKNDSNKRTALLFIVGITLFSGSLYLMALTDVTKFGIITPLGGVSFIAGWLSFCWMVWGLDE